ncbi:MAG: D-alanine--D-alanine ligase [Alphaproteobacteria bacterium]|nr:D-alanine--D-alanine ligase [Alphaproteobacteria bacterium]
MRIGFTYDLRDDYLAMGFGEEETAEFDRVSTIDAIEGALRELGHEVERVGHVKALVGRLAQGARWDLVFNIAEGVRGVGREAQVPALLEAYDLPYTFADPLVASLTLHKAMTKRVLRDLGVATTDFRVVEREADLDAVDLPFPLFVKPLAEGTAKGITSTSRVTTRDELAREAMRQVREFRQPVLVEPYLSGREFTVGITGTGDAARALGTMEIVMKANAEPHAYTYVNKENSEELGEFPLAPPEWAALAEELALRAWRGLGCRDAGRVDVRADDHGVLHVMELNPLAGLHPTHSDLPMIATAKGVSFVELIGRIVASAAERCAEA